MKKQLYGLKLPLIKNGKWYDYPEIYNLFSILEDKDKKCIDLVINYIKNNKLEIINPIDLGCGTGKLYDQLICTINYQGIAYLVDSNSNMIEYLNNKYGNEVKILNSKISDFDLNTNKSNFIISSFGFPSNLFDKNNCICELKNVYENLLDDGVFITIGWNEKWDDELSLLWKKYICDNSDKSIDGARNCNLDWYVNDIQTSITFDNLTQRDYIIYNLFGENAKKDYVDSNKLEWSMHMGITINTKKQLKVILEKLEANHEGN